MYDDWSVTVADCIGIVILVQFTVYSVRRESSTASHCTIADTFSSIFVTFSIKADGPVKARLTYVVYCIY